MKRDNSLKKITGVFGILALCAALPFVLSCWNDLDELQERSENKVVTFASAVNPGQRVKVMAGEVVFYMNYANNRDEITFPISLDYAAPDNDDKATLTRKFFMSETLVTNALMREVLQWAYDNGKIVETGGAHNEVNTETVKYGGRPLLSFVHDNWNMYSKIRYLNGSFTVAKYREDHPVSHVSWYGAIMFCNWLTEMRDGNTDNVVYTDIPTDGTWNEGNNYDSNDDSKTGYRLPSTEEWEYAGRYIGTTAPTVENLASEYIAQNVRDGHADLTPGYYWTPGDYASGANKNTSNETETRAVAWYSSDPDMDGNPVLMPVGLKAANQLYIYDMNGNVHEWCFNVHSTYPARRIIRGCDVWEASETPMAVGRTFNELPEGIGDNGMFTGIRLVRTR